MFLRFTCLFTLAICLSVQSGIAQIKVASVDFHANHQVIRGFGASGGNNSADNFFKLDTADRNFLCDLLFSKDKGIGLTMLRNEIYWSIEPAPGRWDWTQDTAQVWLMHQAFDRGIRYFWSAAWSMPAWMKSNRRPDHGGRLLEAHYGDYAAYLCRYLTEYRERFGIKISGLSIQNEPEARVSYQSCFWQAHEFKRFLAENLSPELEKHHLHPQIIIPEPGSMKLVPRFSDTVLEDPVASRGVSIVAGHQYEQTGRNDQGPTVKDSDEEDYSLARRLGKEYWQTEVSFIDGHPDYGMGPALAMGQLIHHALVGAQVNSWSWWAMLNSWGDNEGLIDLVSGSYRVSKRLYAFGNWSKFIRPGYQRIEMTAKPDASLYCTAFKGGDSLVVVIVNTSQQAKRLSVDLQNYRPTSIDCWITSDDADLEHRNLKRLKHALSRLDLELESASITTYVLRKTGENLRMGITP